MKYPQLPNNFQKRTYSLKKKITFSHIWLKDICHLTLTEPFHWTLGGHSGKSSFIPELELRDQMQDGSVCRDRLNAADVLTKKLSKHSPCYAELLSYLYQKKTMWNTAITNIRPILWFPKEA